MRTRNEEYRRTIAPEFPQGYPPAVAVTLEKTPVHKLSTTARVIAYEAGRLDEDQVVNLFQDLLTGGFLWNLKGPKYQQKATELLAAGKIRQQ